jgi:hypothetical protein
VIRIRHVFQCIYIYFKNVCCQDSTGVVFYYHSYSEYRKIIRPMRPSASESILIQPAETRRICFHVIVLRVAFYVEPVVLILGCCITIRLLEYGVFILYSEYSNCKKYSVGYLDDNNGL